MNEWNIHDLTLLYVDTDTFTYGSSHMYIIRLKIRLYSVKCT